MRITLLTGLVIVLLAAGTASAQAPRDMATGDWVEANRPRMQPRKLTAEETKQVKEYIAQFKKTVESRWADEGWLLKLKPLAETGDKTAMKAMMDGYEKLYDFLPHQKRWPIQGAWGVEYWKLHGPDQDAARSIAVCISGGGKDGVFSSRRSNWDCGFDAVVPKAPLWAAGFLEYGQKKGPAPKNVTFVMRSLAVGGEGDRERFDEIVSLLKGGGDISMLDRTWAKEYADKMGPEQIAALQAAIDDFPNALARLKAVNQRIAAGYREDNLKAWSALDAKSALAPAELEKFEQLSILLGPEYITSFGRKYVIYGKTHIDKTCIIDADVCRMQTALYEERKMQAEAEARARNAPIKDWGAQLFVDVRTYDQSGNYIGTQTMTRSQADTVGAR